MRYKSKNLPIQAHIYRSTSKKWFATVFRSIKGQNWSISDQKNIAIFSYYRNIAIFPNGAIYCNHDKSRYKTLTLVSQVILVLQFWSPLANIWISYKFGHQMVPFSYLANLATRWRHLHWLQIWSPGGVICTDWKFGH